MTFAPILINFSFRGRKRPVFDRLWRRQRTQEIAEGVVAGAAHEAGDGRRWRRNPEPRRVIAKVEWHPGELYPRVAFIVTNMSRPAENVVAFYYATSFPLDR